MNCNEEALEQGVVTFEDFKRFALEKCGEKEVRSDELRRHIIYEILFDVVLPTPPPYLTPTSHPSMRLASLAASLHSSLHSPRRAGGRFLETTA